MKIVIVLFTLILLALPIGCSNQPSAKEQSAQEFFVSASEYLHEFNSLSTLTETRLIEAEKAMRAGEMDMRELGERFHEIYFAEATAIEFLDNLPEYASLMPVMWEDGTPPKLIWDPDNYIYQKGFKQRHALAFIKAGDFINGLEKELGIELQYRPIWYTDIPFALRPNSKVLELWIEVQSIEETLKSLPDKPLYKIGE